MKLEDVCFVYQTTNFMKCNEWLNKGYVILKIFSSKTKTHEVDEVRPCYVLGKAKE